MTLGKINSSEVSLLKGGTTEKEVRLPTPLPGIDNWTPEPEALDRGSCASTAGKRI